VPTVLRIGPYRLHFYSSDGAEPRHIPIARDGTDAKFWLDPYVDLAQNRGYSSQELRDIRRIVEDHLQALKDAWNAYFNP
jgi:Domain of unknown function (DUF4160)